MNFFTKIFGNHGREKANSAQQEHVAEDAVREQTFVPEDLFIEKEPPTAVAEQPVLQDELTAFLEGDHYTKGYNDGYLVHSKDILESSKKRVKADFRLLLDRKTDRMRVEICMLRDHMIETNEISEVMQGRLENRIKEMENIIIHLEKEKELSAMDEGMVMTALHAYHEGFVRGLERYRNEKLLCQSTGLFND